MRKRRLVVIFVLLACALACMAGWFFQRAGGPPLPPGGWQTEFADERSSVSVWHASGTAVSAAAAREAAYISDGWTLLPVSTPTFKLLQREHDLAAILAEDLPDGTTITELLRHGIL